MFLQALALRIYAINKYKENPEDTIYKIWENVGRSNNFNDLCHLVKVAFTLSTSLKNVEQSFSILKLYRTDQRNRLKDENLEGIILIKEEFQGIKSIHINSQILQNYERIIISPSELDLEKVRFLSQKALKVETCNR